MVTMTTDDRAAPAATDIERAVLAFVRRELLGPETAVGRDDDLLSGGLLDSIGVLRLAAFVEEEFRFPVPPADFVIENFRSVAAIAAYIGRATGGGAAAGPR
jgi:acyl carrier protein